MIRFSTLPVVAGTFALAGLVIVACTPAGGDSKVTAPNSASTAPAQVAPESSSKAAAAPAAGGDAASSGPEWKLHGERVVLKSALMKSYGGQMRTLYLSAGPITCDNIKEHGTIMHTEKVMTIRIAPSMKATEAPLVEVVYPTSDKNISTMRLDSHTLKMPPAAEQGIVKMPIDIDFKDSRMDSRPEQSVTFKGPVEFKDCGVFPASTDGEPLPQPKLKLEVSGENVEIKGAVLLPDDKEPRLILTSEPNGCKRDSFADVMVELRYKGNAGLGSATLMGNRLASSYQSSSEKEMKKIKTKLPAKLPSPGSKVEIPVDGELGLPFDQKLKFSGSLTALVCKD